MKHYILLHGAWEEARIWDDVAPVLQQAGHAVTTIDKVTSPALQDRMIANWNVEAMHNLKSGHFPAFSAPKELAELLLKSVRKSEPALA